MLCSFIKVAQTFWQPSVNMGCPVSGFVEFEPLVEIVEQSALR